MAFRRASTNSLPAAPDLGRPYQIFSEVVGTGKNLAGSKTKVKWQYGYSNSEQEHCIEFKISFLTGNKRVISDGREIFSGGSILETEFSHSWPQDGHLFRIDCALSLTEEHSFILLIDSVQYKNLTTKSGLSSDCTARQPDAVTAQTHSKGFGARSDTGSNGSVGTGTHKRGGSDSHTATPPRKEKEVDFFAADNSFNSDPFGVASSDPFATTTPSKQAFDPFGDAPAPVQVHSHAPVQSLLPPAHPRAPVHNSSKPVEFDPFGMPAAAPVKQTAPATVFDPFAMPAAAAPVPRKPNPLDLFATPSAASDPFAPQQKLAVDFSNLSFTPPPAVAPAPVVHETSAPAKKDVYGGLVNLDLGGGPPGGAMRRQSLGPMNGNANAMNANTMNGNGRPVSMAMGGGANPFASAGITPTQPQYGGYNANPTGAPANNNRRASMGAAPGGYSQQQPTSQQKSSLDALNWKS